LTCVSLSFAASGLVERKEKEKKMENKFGGVPRKRKKGQLVLKFISVSHGVRFRKSRSKKRKMKKEKMKKRWRKCREI
jgi:hypothetical protein